MEYCLSWGTYVHRTLDGERTLCGIRAGAHPIEPNPTDNLCDQCETADSNG